MHKIWIQSTKINFNEDIGQSKNNKKITCMSNSLTFTYWNLSKLLQVIMKELLTSPPLINAPNDTFLAGFQYKV